MFRDLKEYQEIAKIYAEKVSKPENLEERKGSSPEQLAQNRKDAFKGVPNSPSNKRAEMSKKRRGDKKFEFNKPTGGAQGRTRRPEIKKSLPTTAEIRAKDKAAGGTGMSNIPSKEGNAVIDGKKLNPDFGKKVDIKKEFPDKVDPKPMSTKDKFNSKFIKKVKGKGFVKRGTPGAQRAENKEKAKNRAKEMAKARIAAKKKAEMSEGMAGALIKGGSKLVPALMTGIGAVGTMMQSKKKQGTKGGGQGFGGEKPANAEVKAPKKEKKPRLNIGKRASGRDRNFIQGGGAGGMESVEYDAYDLVLEYLISTEQVATIEEANYVMTEMDAETIQSIVEEQKKNLDEMDMMKMPVVNVLGGLAAGAAAVKGAASYLGRKAGEKSIKKTEPKKPGLIKTIKDRTDATNKAIEKM